MQSVSNIITKFVGEVVNPIIAVFFAIGFLIFVYGIFEFIMGMRKGAINDEGKSHMLWGLVGMLIMVSVLGIINLLKTTLGIDLNATDVRFPRP
ncbi:MAG TPA: hypothetical protein VJL39_00940 [Candidatus Paceibacterota bacterium]